MTVKQLICYGKIIYDYGNYWIVDNGPDESMKTFIKMEPNIQHELSIGETVIMGDFIFDVNRYELIFPKISWKLCF